MSNESEPMILAAAELTLRQLSIDELATLNNFAGWSTGLRSRLGKQNAELLEKVKPLLTENNGEDPHPAVKVAIQEAFLRRWKDTKAGKVSDDADANPSGAPISDSAEEIKTSADHEISSPNLSSSPEVIAPAAESEHRKLAREVYDFERENVTTKLVELERKRDRILLDLKVQRGEPVENAKKYHEVLVELDLWFKIRDFMIDIVGKIQEIDTE